MRSKDRSLRQHSCIGVAEAAILFTAYNGKYRLNNARNAAGFTGLAR
jgi:hypothetical protein